LSWSEFFAVAAEPDSVCRGSAARDSSSAGTGASSRPSQTASISTATVGGVCGLAGPAWTSVRMIYAAEQAIKSAFYCCGGAVQLRHD
jgi:hypothetical protein